VRPLADRLRKDGLKVWFDEWVLKPGDSIPAKIEKGFAHSNILRKEGDQMCGCVKLSPFRPVGCSWSVALIYGPATHRLA